MKLSIIVPCYNVSEYIEECLKSLLPLNKEDYEVICVNDGSTDETLLKIRNFESQFRNF